MAVKLERAKKYAEDWKKKLLKKIDSAKESISQLEETGEAEADDDYDSLKQFITNMVEDDTDGEVTDDDDEDQDEDA